MQRTHFSHSKGSNRAISFRPGFTLIEMLVSTALVLLLMTMFAQIYATTSSIINLQRGIAKNDQRARTLNNTLNRDLASRSYRQVRGATGQARGIVPLTYGDEADTQIDLLRQRGYFYISENDPNNDVDDLLQFTVMLDEQSSDPETQVTQSKMYYGKVQSLNRYFGGLVSDEPSVDAYRSNPFENSPSLDPNATVEGRSEIAEISYFVRDGNLYRRVLLIRDEPTIPDHGQPLVQGFGKAFGTAGEPYSLTEVAQQRGVDVNDFDVGDFDFDYSKAVRYDFGRGINPENQPFLWIHSKNSLDNSPLANPYDVTDVQVLRADALPLGMPWNRFGFGFSPSFGNGNVLAGLDGSTGRSIEFRADGTYFGRPLLEENSVNAEFWKSRTNSSANPQLLVEANNRQRRISEEVLMSNVDGFDVQICDELPNVYYNIDQSALVANGLAPRTNSVDHTTLPGPLNRIVNPILFSQNVFDTWHPNAGSSLLTGDSLSTPGFGDFTSELLNRLLSPPDDVIKTYRLSKFIDPPYRKGSYVSTKYPLGGTTVLPSDHPDGLSTLERFLALGTNPSPSELQLLDGIDLTLGDTAAYVYRPRLRSIVPLIDQQLVNDSFVYRPLRIRKIGPSTNPDPPPNGTDGPFSTTKPGIEIPVMYRFEEVPGSGEFFNYEVTFLCLDNRVGLKSIKVTVRYRDPGRDLPKQVSVIHSFVE